MACRMKLIYDRNTYVVDLDRVSAFCHTQIVAYPSQFLTEVSLSSPLNKATQKPTKLF
ncbi:MAG: hypothetical protein LH647_10660 [Leptolyngbyaceae cyanobacterium CAN_BIN12]|nr:hypothetical protein [Leptolyngbyaceae cyanobacterium CAN_BIN12]